MLNLNNNLILIRHAENEVDYSKDNNLLELSALGIEQAKIAHEILKDKFDIVICSNSLRTISTAKIIAPNYDLICDDQLLERGWGNEKHDGTETDFEAYERIKNVITKYCNQYPNMNILMVTHGSLMKLAQNYIEEKDIEYSRDLVDNCDIAFYTKDGNKNYIKVKK